MPTDIVTVDTSIQAATIAPSLFNEIVVIGTEAGGAAADNTVVLLDNLADVATQFGGTGDIYAAAAKIFAQGVSRIYAVRATKTNVAAEAVTAGSLQTLANAPVHGKTTITVVGKTVQFTTGVPTDPGVGNAEINTKTGGIWINGAGSINVSYDYIDWTSVFTAIADYDVDIVCLAEYTATTQAYGDLDTAQDSIDAGPYISVYAAEKSATAADIVTMMANYSSRNIIALAHKSDDDIGAAACGIIAVTEPWDKLMWKQIQSITTDYYLDSEVTTLETGKVNAIIERGGADRFSDGLTTVGGDYKFIDITRTQYYLESLIITEVGNTITSSRVPYTPLGIGMIQSSIAKACERAVVATALREPFDDGAGNIQRGYIIQMPDFDSISDADKTARLLQNIFVTAYLAGHIQTVSINLSIVI